MKNAEHDPLWAGWTDRVVVRLDVHDELEAVVDAVLGVGDHGSENGYVDTPQRHPQWENKYMSSLNPLKFTAVQV